MASFASGVHGEIVNYQRKQIKGNWGQNCTINVSAHKKTCMIEGEIDGVVVDSISLNYLTFPSKARRFWQLLFDCFYE